MSIVPSNILGDIFNTDLSSWFQLNMREQRGINKDWGSLWSIICHALWTWINKGEHTEGYGRPSDLVVHLLKRKQDYAEACSMFKQNSGNGNGKRLLGWQPPTSNMVKLNTDGGRKMVGNAGCKGLVRDHRGEWICNFSKYLGKCSVLLAEFRGVYEGLKIA